MAPLLRLEQIFTSPNEIKLILVNVVLKNVKKLIAYLSSLSTILSAVTIRVGSLLTDMRTR